MIARDLQTFADTADEFWRDAPSAIDHHAEALRDHEAATGERAMAAAERLERGR